MSTGITGTYSLPYPLLTDEVNVHEDIQLLAETTEDILLTKANLQGGNTFSGSISFTGTVSGITKSMVGLGSVDNTADSAKPVSTATQTALDLKANLASPSFTGNISVDGNVNLLTGNSYKINNTSISTTLPGLTWGEVKNGKNGLVIS